MLNLSAENLKKILSQPEAQTTLMAKLEEGREQHRQNLASFFEKCLEDFTEPKTRIKEILNTLNVKYAGKPHELLMELGSTLSETHGFLTGIEKVDDSFMFSFLREWEPFQKKSLQQFRKNQKISHQGEAIKVITDMRDKQHQFLPIANSMAFWLDNVARENLDHIAIVADEHPDDVLITAVTYDPLKEKLCQDLHLGTQLGSVPDKVYCKADNGEMVLLVSSLHQRLYNPEVSSQGISKQAVLDVLQLSFIDDVFKSILPVDRSLLEITPSTSIRHTELPPAAFTTAFQREW